MLEAKQGYADFLETKQLTGIDSGIDVADSQLNSMLYPFQRELVRWALRKGHAAIFADCGLGKTPMQLEWAHQLNMATGKPVLILTPLAVGHQTVREGEKFGIEAHVSRDGIIIQGINVTNYEKLHLFNPLDFGAIVCDESSILKNFDGIRKAEITEFMRQIPYRLLCTATASPNDYTELGTSSEALGYLGYIDMLNQFFTNKNNTTDTKARFRGEMQPWRFKVHGEADFWRWVCSWARALRRPSDMGFADDGFDLPELITRETIVKTTVNWSGQLFPKIAEGLAEQRKERRATLTDRCEAAAKLVDHDKPAVIWCHLNDEGDLLDKLIPDAVQVSGNDVDEQKESVFRAFADGQIRVLITKPRIGGFGLNWQHCAHVVYFITHSYEQYYQAVRRCWRFGQTQPVTVDNISSEGDVKVMENLQRKSDQAITMFDSLVSQMYDSLHIDRRNDYQVNVEIPQWL